jgi:hypothetical protein
MREGRVLARSLESLAGYGYLSPQEVPWLARIPARRSARGHAALQGGPQAEHLMREYQQQAIELAVLHNRVMRGTAPPGSAERGALMTQRLAALRAHVSLAQHPAGLGQRQGWR